MQPEPDETALLVPTYHHDGPVDDAKQQPSTHNRAHGSGSMWVQVGALFRKQWRSTRARPVATCLIFIFTLLVQGGICYAWTSGLATNYRHIKQTREAQTKEEEVSEDAMPGALSMSLIIFWGMYVLRISSDLCTEKRDRIREGMRMMGLRT